MRRRTLLRQQPLDLLNEDSRESGDSRRPIGEKPLAKGAVSKFVLWVGPLPLRWTAVQRSGSDRGFTDVQASGPAAAWAHTHTFTPLSDGRTRIDEHIEYAHKPGLWGVAKRILFSKTNLWLIFSYRRFVIGWFLCRRSVLR